MSKKSEKSMKIVNIEKTYFFKKPTCFKNPENTDYIDLMLSNSPNSFR